MPIWKNKEDPAKCSDYDEDLSTNQKMPSTEPNGETSKMLMAGRGHLTFSVEIVGIAKGENLPPSSVQPTPLYPPLEQKPVPLQAGEEAEYMLALKQEFRGAMRNLPFYIRPAAPRRDVERYSDKYQRSESSDNSLEWKPGAAGEREETPERQQDKTAGEAEVLMNECVKTSRCSSSALHSDSPAGEYFSDAISSFTDSLCLNIFAENQELPKLPKQPRMDKEEILRKLETLEQKEVEETSDEEEGENKKQEEEVAEGEELDEEEFEDDPFICITGFAERGLIAACSKRGWCGSSLRPSMV
ncbi:hypothetical protein DNTS_016623 [Danionella cerebrum]|uniref:Uncharacterized protein n=1 Tax=Danionella cerebrum TaxID=2873325 RepID=A0A553N1P7_9TELE|nr:hypothetical protein DNTS_016623 [Danionella translucida]